MPDWIHRVRRAGNDDYGYDKHKYYAHDSYRNHDRDR
jgi:hypothetical protein